MKVGVSRFLPIFFAVAGVGLVSVFAWTELPVADDPNVFMPGSQPGSVNLESVNRCDNCHGGYNPAIEPAHNWRGSMMAHAARDPLWMACLTVALQDSIWAVGNANAGDLCIRCHTPGGWLGGRSDPPNTTALSAGAGDFEGVSCDACHRMVDPFNALRQAPELPAETDATAALEAEATYELDRAMLEQLVLFSGPPFFDPASRLPTFFGDGLLPGYIESTSGQYFIDPYNTKRGPRFDAEPKHRWSYSRFHKSKYLCATCHDVSNPVLANLTDPGSPERQAAASYFHVERTFSEFMLSAYGQPGGSETRGGVADSGVAWAAKCQDCHMRDVTGTAANKRGILTRPDLALHDLTGGNTWISGILASADPASIAYDPYNYAILSGAKYAAARVDVDGLQGHGNALLDGRERAFQQLELAADLAVVSDTDTELVLQILNNTGHKLISGFPEGRRMWLT